MNIGEYSVRTPVISWLLVIILVQITAAAEAPRHLTVNPPVAAHKPAEHIAVQTVPLGPAKTGEITDLVKTRRVPGLGDNACITEHARELDIPQHRGVVQGLAILAA